MLPIFEEIKASNIVELGTNTYEITENILEYCVNRNAHLTIINPLEDEHTAGYISAYGNRLDIINQNVLKQISLLKNYDILVMNLDEDYQYFYDELKAIENGSKNTNFPIIFLLNLKQPNIVSEKWDGSEKIDSDENTIYEDYKDVIDDFRSKTGRELSFNFLEINSTGILFETEPKIDEFIARNIDLFSSVENEHLDMKNELEKCKSESKYIETRIDEVKTEFEFKNNKYRSLSQRITSKFPFLHIIRYLPRTGLKGALINRKGYYSIKDNNLLDIGYYLNTYSDVKLTGKDPIIHYIYHGFNEGRNPCPEFDAKYYFETHPDVQKSKLNPLVHYALYGINENRKTYPPRVDTNSYGEELYLNMADMSIEGSRKIGEEEVSEAILKIDDENFKVKQEIIIDENNNARFVIKFNIPPAFIDGKNHNIRLYDGYDGYIISKKKMILSQHRNFRDFSGFLNNSLVSPFVYAPFREQDKRCFATMEDIAKYLTSKSDNNNIPLVSVIIPVYNSIKTIQKTVYSVLNQSYPNLELVIVDGGSTDGSFEYLKNLNHEKLILIQNSDCKEISSARNLALTAANGKYVTYLNPCCTWDLRYIKAMMGAFNILEDADAVYSGQLLFDDDNDYPFAVKFGSLNRSLLENRNYIDMNSVCHTRNLYKRIGGFDEVLNEYADWDWIMRMVKDSQVYSIPVLLSNYHRLNYNPELDKHHLELVRKKQAERMNVTKSTHNSGEILNKVSIVIPSYESLEDIQECLNAILELNVEDWVEIIVVDNNSSKPVTDYLTKMELDSKIKLIKNQINYGFTFAVNQGIEIAENRNDILLMNNDAIITPGAINAMQNAAHSLHDCGVVVPQQVLFSENRALTKHVPYSSLDYECDVNLSGLFNNIINVPIFHSGKFTELNFAPFFCVYIKRDILDNSSGLNAEFGRHYRSDRIFCNYIRHVMNLKVFHVVGAIVYHKEQKSTEILRENSKDDYDIIFSQNQWDKELASKFGYKTPFWDF